MVPNSGQQRPGVGGGKGESAERDLPGLRGIFGLPIRKDLIFKATEQTERRAAPPRRSAVCEAYWYHRRKLAWSPDEPKKPTARPALFLGFQGLSGGRGKRDTVHTSSCAHLCEFSSRASVDRRPAPSPPAAFCRQLPKSCHVGEEPSLRRSKGFR